MVKPVLVRRRRRMISVIGRTPQQPAPPNRSGMPISVFTDGMASRLGAFVDNFREDFTGMATLTYPDTYPVDGRVVKAQFRAFIERLRRTGWFEEQSLVWFLEFQRRGAPHFHLLLTGWVSKTFVSLAWAEVTGGNPASCSKVEALRSPEAAGWYARKYATKAEQKTPPAEYKNVGRFWGCRGPRQAKDGTPRVPVVEASTSFPLSWVRNAIQSFVKRGKGGRFFEHETGCYFFGTEEETQRLWLSLQVAGLFVEGHEIPSEECRPLLLVDLPNTLG